MNTMYIFQKSPQMVKSVVKSPTQCLTQKKRLAHLVVAVIFIIGLVGCGQKGDLYLPSTITTPTLDTDVGQTDKTGQDF